MLGRDKKQCRKTEQIQKNIELCEGDNMVAAIFKCFLSGEITEVLSTRASLINSKNKATLQID